jgi:hypothetical protein
MTDFFGVSENEFFSRGRDDASSGSQEGGAGKAGGGRGRPRRNSNREEADVGFEALRGAPRVFIEHPIRSLLSEVRDELLAFTRQSNREPGAVGFGERGPDSVSIAPIRMVCREAVNRLEAQFDHLGDQSIVTVKFREIAQEAQTSLQEFDIYLTQSNFRQGLVPEGELTGVLLGANSLRGILGRKILEFDEVIAHLRQG